MTQISFEVSSNEDAVRVLGTHGLIAVYTACQSIMQHYTNQFGHLDDMEPVVAPMLKSINEINAFTVQCMEFVGADEDAINRYLSEFKEIFVELQEAAPLPSPSDS